MIFQINNKNKKIINKHNNKKIKEQNPINKNKKKKFFLINNSNSLDLTINETKQLILLFYHFTIILTLYLNHIFGLY